MFRSYSTLLYSCSDAGEYLLDPTQGLCSSRTDVQTLLPSSFDVGSHRLLGSYIGMQTSIRSYKSVSSSEQNVVYRLPDKAVYLPRSCSAVAHKLQCR
jgi:hypothetical protein